MKKKKEIWIRGYDWGIKKGYTDTRDNRIIAMAFEAGWKAAKKKNHLSKKYKEILFHAWALRNQFNGERDEFYFPKLAESLDALFPPDKSYPLNMYPDYKN